MTNAEKYEEVFGLPVDPSMCPTRGCNNCPVYSLGIVCSDSNTEEWWGEEYKGGSAE